ncbi:MAG: 2-amino-4-hydroxy-6-hydroxymethyldihydropteridine diphosphokinase [Rhodospirillaceae bacterium]|nr:MAG: 2-amino-4-hydroxy-6-hydroxymethyldihydropteridine diphosphokinase [Rhodospirillaceae bacterium]
MIFIGIGANLPSERFGAPVDTCAAAVKALQRISNTKVKAQSTWFESAPVPVSDQPWYINGVVQIETDLNPLDLLQALHDIEADFGRVRAERNAARILDLDLLVYDDLHLTEHSPRIPHPRLQDRAFVVLPLAEIAPDWVHPVTGEKLREMAAKLPKDQLCRPVS